MELHLDRLVFRNDDTVGHVAEERLVADRSVNGIGSVGVVLGENHVLRPDRHPRNGAPRKTGTTTHTKHAERGVHREIAGTPLAHLHHFSVDEVGLADEVGDERAARPVVDLSRRSLLDDQAVVHDADPVRHRKRFDLLVGDEQGRDAERGDEIADFGPHLLAKLGVEV